MTGTVVGVPYTEHDEENTNSRTSAARHASISSTVPATLFRQYLAGDTIDSPTDLYAAKWTTCVTPYFAAGRRDELVVGDVADDERSVDDGICVAEFERVEHDDVVVRAPEGRERCVSRCIRRRR